MRTPSLLVLCLASLSAAAGELLPFNQVSRAVAPVPISQAVKVDQSVFDRFTQQARGLDAKGRASLKTQFEGKLAAARAANNASSAEYYARLIGILQSINGP